MKNWKFIQVGNETVGPNWDKKRQLEDELRGWMTMVNKLDGDERRNAEKQIADIRKELNDVKIKIAHGENKKAGNESIDKQTWSMFKGLTKKAEEEVGNARSKEQLLADVRELTKYIKDNPDRPCEKEKRLLGEAKEELDKRYGVIVGNFKTGKSKLSVGDKVSLYGVKGTVKGITGENSDNIYGEPVIEFESEDGKTKQVPEHYLVKVGNKVIAGDYYDVVMSGSHFYIYKNGGSQIIGPFNSEQEAQKKIDAIEKERSRTGNETLGQWAKAKPRTINGLRRARNAMVKNAMSVSDLERRIKENEKYIRSLQGKTVDGEGWPAKDAIQEAQDEIDMMKSRIAELTKQGNKKVKNSSVREYKDSEGRIAQIDFNSDGTDADLSIYEDERMTRTVESKNFSTIRDAEQYVQSHGFKRVG